MKRVTLVRLEITAFKSFREECAVDFPTAPGFRLLTGDNRVEPRLGANGAGKSSLWDAFFWCCYGVSVRGHRAGDLVSWGHKRPLVRAHLDINGELVVIARQGSPDRLSVNGVAATQAEVTALLGLSATRMRHAVVFGQGAPLLLDLSIAERGLLLDEVLDLGIWQKSADQATKHAREQEQRINAAKIRRAEAAGQLQGIEDDAVLEQRESTWEQVRQASIEKALEELEGLGKEVDAAAQRERDAAAALAKHDLAQVKRDAAAQRALEGSCASLRTKAAVAARAIETVRAQAKHILDNPNCPTCHQRFPEDARKDELRRLAEEEARLQQERAAAEASLATTELNLEDLRSDAAAAQQAVRGLEREHASWQASHRAAQTAFTQCERRIEQMGNDTNPYTEQRATAARRRAEADARHSAAELEIAEAEVFLARLEFWKKAFKRVRLFMVARVLKHLELEVANAAAMLGLPGWSIRFTTETETRSGSTTQGVQIQVSSPQASGPWELWSGGEGQRVRLAVAMGFAALVQRMSGVSYSWEVWDEPSAWLSPEGIEDLLEALKQRCEVGGKALWLLDHRALTHTGFAEIWSVVKDAQGSRVSKG